MYESIRDSAMNETLTEAQVAALTRAAEAANAYPLWRDSQLWQQSWLWDYDLTTAALLRYMEASSESLRQDR